MPTLHELNFARKWLELALQENKLAHYIIGVPPYAKTEPGADGFHCPILLPNLICLYDYAGNHEGFDRQVEATLFQTIEDAADNGMVLSAALVFLNLQLSRELAGTAGFRLDCAGLLRAVYRAISEHCAGFDKAARSNLRFQTSGYFITKLMERESILPPDLP